MFRTIFSGLAVALAVPACAATQIEQEPTAFVGVDLLTMVDDELLTDQTVIVEGNRIVAVGDQDEVSIPSNAHRIDGDGLTMMPGLVDMHVHLSPGEGNPGDPAHRVLTVNLAHGVTTVRSMLGDPSHIGLRAKAAKGEIDSPRLYLASPPVYEGNTNNVEEAVKAVEDAEAIGYDLIKSHHLTDPEMWQALKDRADELGLPTAGHLTNEVGLARAEKGRQQIEHLDGLLFELIPEGAPERDILFAQFPPPAVVRAAAKASDEDYHRLARRVAAGGTYHAPTLSLFDLMLATDIPLEDLQARPELRYVSPFATQQWSGQYNQLIDGLGYTEDDLRSLQTIRHKLVSVLYEAGVPMMAGSDAPQYFTVWGPALYGEVNALREVAMSPIDALRAATVVPRDYLRSLQDQGSATGALADFGTVEAGAIADLVLFDYDPREGLAERPQMVMSDGRLYDREVLDAMLEAAARVASAMPPPQQPQQ